LISAFCEARADGPDRTRRVLVLPEPEHQPPTSRQQLVSAPISSNVGIQLGTPPLGIGLRGTCVKWAAVPIAAVDENHHPEAAPHNVTPDSQVGLKSDVDAIPDALGVQPLTDRKLRAGVSAPLSPHPLLDELGRRLRAGGHRSVLRQFDV
jgi:hypothetical protein